jgi:hypothetical protein
MKGHATNAAGFVDGDNTTARQLANNNLLMQNCGKFINSASN